MKKITFKQLQEAIEKSPKAVHKAGAQYIQKGITEYEKIVKRSPWRVGQSGGGAPVRTGDLKTANKKTFDFNRLIGRLGVDEKMGARAEYRSKEVSKVIDYAVRVHKKRPWLDYAQLKAENEIEKLYQDFGNEVLKIIAK